MAIDIEKEKAEAINAANDALYYLGRADEILNKARNWGLADIMGGGMLITAVKRQRMREASEEINRARAALNLLNEELLDLNNYFTLDIGLDDFLSAADYIFDNFFDCFCFHRLRCCGCLCCDALSCSGCHDGSACSDGCSRT